MKFQESLYLKTQYAYLFQHDSLTDKDFEAELRKKEAHIYNICRAPKIRIDPAATLINTDAININFYCHDLTGNRHDIFLSTPKNDIVSFSCERPYMEISFFNDEGKSIVHSVQSASYLLRDLCRQQGLYHTVLDLEVLYTGQSLGENFERITLDRLIHHEKVQKIYHDTMRNYEGYDIYFTTFTFHSSSLKIAELPIGNFKNKLIVRSRVNEEKPIPFDQTITAAEAAIIRYFGTEVYNTEYLSFPKTSHTSYQSCYQYNSISLEIDTQPIYTRLYSQKIEPSFQHTHNFHLKTKRNKDAMFGWLSK